MKIEGVPVEVYPFGLNERDRCPKLNEDLTCSIYEDRPDICRCDVMYEELALENETLGEYYKRIESACEILQKGKSTILIKN